MQLILGWRGYASDVKVGAKLEPTGEFEAHAWLTSGDQIVIGGSEAEIAKFAFLSNLVDGQA